MALIQTLKRHPLLTYFVLAYVLSWACWIPMAIFKETVSFRFYVFYFLGNIMPSLLGILLTALFSGKSGLGGLFRRLGQVRVPLIWYAVVLLLVPGLQLVAVGVPTLLGKASITFAWSGLVVLNAFRAGLSEELGWRGFALPRLQASFQALPASLLLGVLWGLWHLPYLIAFGQLPLTSAGLVFVISFVLGTTAYSVLFTWVYNNTKGSLFLMVLFHTVIDVPIVAAGNSWMAAVLYPILLWSAVALVVLMAGPARLSRAAAPAPAKVG